MSSNTLHLSLNQEGPNSSAMVFDSRGQLRAQADCGIETFRSRDNHVEHDPVELVQSLTNAALDALSQMGKQACIRNAGLSTQRSSIVCWDRVTGEAISNVISWQDRRASDWVASKGSYQNLIHSQTGLVLSPHYGMSKLRWCLDNIATVSESFARGRLAWGPVASFLLHRLLKEHPLKIDPANASRTLVWDVTTRNWSEQLLDLFQLPPKPFPRCVPSQHDFGHLAFTNQAIPLSVTTGDRSAALFALGLPKDDVIYLDIGAGAFIQQPCGSKPLITPNLLTSIVFQDEREAHYVLEGTVNGAGSALRAKAEELSMNMDLVRAESETWLDEVKEPPLFLNGVSGLGSPYWEPKFSSEMVGKGSAKEQMVAVMESVVFLVNMNVKELAKHLPKPKKIIVTGDLASMDGLCQMLANLSGIRVERPKLAQAAARGLAFLCANSDGWVPTGPAVGFPAQQDKSIEKRFALWRQLLRAKLS